MVNGFWAVVTELSLLGWSAAAVVFIWKAFAGGTFQQKAWPWGAFLVGMYGVWILAMLNA